MSSRTGRTFTLRRRDVAAVCLVGMGQAVTLVAFLLLVRSIVDTVQLEVQAVGTTAPAQVSDAVLRQLGALLLVVVGYGLLRAFEFSLTERAGYRAAQALRMRMYAHLQGMTPRQIQGRSRGALLLRFTGDLSM